MSRRSDYVVSLKNSVFTFDFGALIPDYKQVHIFNEIKGGGDIIIPLMRGVDPGLQPHSLRIKPAKLKILSHGKKRVILVFGATTVEESRIGVDFLVSVDLYSLQMAIDVISESHIVIGDYHDFFEDLIVHHIP